MSRWGIEGRASPARRDAEGGDGRNLGPVAGTTQMRRVAPRSPGADHAGDQQEAALIEERQMGAKSSGLFLYGATDTASTARWPLRRARERASRASGSSSRAPSKCARDDWGGSPPRTACGSPRPHGGSSRDPWRTRSARPPVTGGASASASAAGSAAPAAPVPAWRSGRALRGRESVRASQRRHSRTNRPWRPPPRGLAPSVATRWRAADASRDAPGSHGVACLKGIKLSITYA